jgi:hypothetical protein
MRRIVRRRADSTASSRGSSDGSLRQGAHPNVVRARGLMPTSELRRKRAPGEGMKIEARERLRDEGAPLQ